MSFFRFYSSSGAGHSRRNQPSVSPDRLLFFAEPSIKRLSTLSWYLHKYVHDKQGNLRWERRDSVDVRSIFFLSFFLCYLLLCLIVFSLSPSFFSLFFLSFYFIYFPFLSVYSAFQTKLLSLLLLEYNRDWFKSLTWTLSIHGRLLSTVCMDNTVEKWLFLDFPR